MSERSLMAGKSRQNSHEPHRVFKSCEASFKKKISLFVRFVWLAGENIPASLWKID